MKIHFALRLSTVLKIFYNRADKVENNFSIYITFSKWPIDQSSVQISDYKSLEFGTNLVWQFFCQIVLTSVNTNNLILDNANIKQTINCKHFIKNLHLSKMLGTIQLCKYKCLSQNSDCYIVEPCNQYCVKKI